MKLLPNLLLVTANEDIRSECRNAIEPMHWPLTETDSAHEALCILEAETEIDVLLLDLELPDADGITLASEVTKKFGTIKRIMIAQDPSKDELLRAINKGHVQNLFTLPVKRIHLHEAILHAYKTKQRDDERKSFETQLQDKYQSLKYRSKDLKSKAKKIQDRNKDLSQDLKNRTQELAQTSLFIDAAQMDLAHAYNQSVQVLSSLLEIHSQKQGRGKRIAELATVLAHELDLTAFETQQVGYAALLTEACKVVLTDRLTSKPLQEMNKQERMIYEKYPVIAQSALMPLEHLQGAAEYLRSVDENLDGTGFPDQLKGGAIPMASRIIRVVRDYIALISGDYEGVELDQAQALANLRLHANKVYDSELLDILDRLLQIRAKPTIPVAIQINGLKEGMVIAHDFFTKHHVLLLAKGTIISEPLIDKIVSYQQDSGEILILPIDKDSVNTESEYHSAAQD